MIDQVGIDRILEIASLVVWQKDVDRFRAGVTTVGAKLRTRLCRDAMVDGVDDVVLRSEQTICLDLFQGLRYGLLAEGASDLLESEQF